MNTDLDQRLRNFAARQHDVLSREQARKLGAYRRQLRVLIALGL